jgi:hypothetical protein
MTTFSQDIESPVPPAAAEAIADIAKNMAMAARHRRVGRMCLLAALMRLADEIDDIRDVHAPAISNAPGAVPAEMTRLKSAVSESIAALKREG